MALIKVCPQCSKHNSATAFECVSCGFDITGERPVQEEFLSRNDESVEEAVAIVKTCPYCGEKNASNARVCASCGEDISDQFPESFEQESIDGQKQTFVLKSYDGAYAFSLNNGETIVGREHKMKEYLSDKMFVSRVHCRFTVKDGELFIESLNPRNSTFVNNQRICTQKKLLPGDEIGLGGNNLNNHRQMDAAYFIVGIE